jgi:progressive ankylosis protein
MFPLNNMISTLFFVILWLHHAKRGDKLMIGELVKINKQSTYQQLWLFFLPLGLSATLVTLSHVIIASTLTRAADPKLVIASYTIAMSLITLLERPVIILRQTCSALVRDVKSFRAMLRLTFIVLAFIMAISVTIGFTPIGDWVFLYIFGVDSSILNSIIDVFRVLMFVIIFSGFRCLYHGVIISNMRTKWLTIGMVIRLIGMIALSLYFIKTGVFSGVVGAIIFVSGMIIECAVSMLEGSSLLRKLLPKEKEEHGIGEVRQLLPFYKPLLYSSVLSVCIAPIINIVLGKSMDVTLAISSFAIASSLLQLILSFFSYVHQIVLNFYAKDSRNVTRFVAIIGFIPALLIAVFAFTPVGPWFLTHAYGVNEELMLASLHALRILELMALLFPWVDYCNGILMLRGQNRFMVWTQSFNIAVTLVTLLLTILLAPSWNGMIGALAQSLGLAAELSVLAYILFSESRSLLEQKR